MRLARRGDNEGTLYKKRRSLDRRCCACGWQETLSIWENWSGGSWKTDLCSPRQRTRSAHRTGPSDCRPVPRLFVGDSQANFGGNHIRQIRKVCAASHQTVHRERTPANLTPQHLQKLYADKLSEGFSPTSLHHLHAAIHRALGLAVR